MNQQAALTGNIGIRFQLECRDANGNLLETIEVTGTLPLETPKDNDGLDDQRGG
jgi:hypothetical protein